MFETNLFSLKLYEGQLPEPAMAQKHFLRAPMVKMKQHPSRSSLPPPMQPLPAVGSHAGVNKHIFFYTGWQSNPGKKKLFFFNIDSSKKKKNYTDLAARSTAV